MPDSISPHRAARHLETALVLRVCEGECEVITRGRVRAARYAAMFPSPRVERVQPGNLVALTRTADDAVDTVLWRWFDAVVLGEGEGGVHLWEPAHGEVTAQPRPAYHLAPPGSRAYLSAGLPGADWWVAGRAVIKADEADVELDEVENLYTAHGLWTALE